jgi:hypothetical protein
LPEFLEGLSDRPQKAAVIQAFINQSDGTQSGRPKVANFADTLTSAFGADTHGLLSLADDLANLGALNDGSGRPIAPDAVPLGDALYARTSTVDHGMHYLMRFGESVGTTFEREFIQTFVRDVVQPLERIPADIMGIPKGVRQNGIGWLLNDLPPIISNEPKLAAAGASGLAKVLERFLPAATKGPLPTSAKAIDQVAIREIERGVRAGESAVPLNAGAQLRAVADSFANKILIQLKAANPARAEEVRAAGLDALYRLDRFKVLTPEAMKQLGHIIRTAK